MPLVLNNCIGIHNYIINKTKIKTKILNSFHLKYTSTLLGDRCIFPERATPYLSLQYTTVSINTPVDNTQRYTSQTLRAVNPSLCLDDTPIYPASRPFLSTYPLSIMKADQSLLTDHKHRFVYDDTPISSERKSAPTVHLSFCHDNIPVSPNRTSLDLLRRHASPSPLTVCRFQSPPLLLDSHLARRLSPLDFEKWPFFVAHRAAL